MIGDEYLRSLDEGEQYCDLLITIVYKKLLLNESKSDIKERRELWRVQIKLFIPDSFNIIL